MRISLLPHPSEKGVCSLMTFVTLIIRTRLSSAWLVYSWAGRKCWLRRHLRVTYVYTRVMERLLFSLCCKLALKKTSWRVTMFSVLRRGHVPPFLSFYVRDFVVLQCPAWAFLASAPWIVQVWNFCRGVQATCPRIGTYRVPFLTGPFTKRAVKRKSGRCVSVICVTSLFVLPTCNSITTKVCSAVSVYRFLCKARR